MTKPLPNEYTLEYEEDLDYPINGKMAGTSLDFSRPDSRAAFPSEGDLVTLDGVEYRVTEIDIEEEDVLDMGTPYHSVFCSVKVERS